MYNTHMAQASSQFDEHIHRVHQLFENKIIAIRTRKS